MKLRNSGLKSPGFGNSSRISSPKVDSKNRSMFRRVSAVLLGTFLATNLMGCITVQVPDPGATPTSVRPTSSATTFTAEPAETTPEEEAEGQGNESSGTGSEDGQPSEQDVVQEVDFTITGGCLESYDELGYYGIFEEFDDDCYLVVEVFPASPARFAELQYFDSTWITESSGRTDSSGIVYLEVDQYCEDGFWCEGVWDYRIAVEAEGSLPAERSTTFELEFSPEP